MDMLLGTVFSYPHFNVFIHFFVFSFFSVANFRMTSSPKKYPCENYNSFLTRGIATIDPLGGRSNAGDFYSTTLDDKKNIKF